eukprot:SM000046S16394  [mRNA]  locus=s46:326696:327886:- [translate_table: standard]
MPAGAAAGKDGGAGRFALSVAWSSDGALLACSTMDGTIGVFDTASGKLSRTLEGHAMAVRSLAFSPIDERLLFTACDDQHVHVYDARARELVAAMSGHAGWVLSVAASPDGAAIATGSSDKSVRLWDLKMRAAVQTFTEHTDQVWAVCFRPPDATTTDSRLAAVSDDRSISLYTYS